MKAIEIASELRKDGKIIEMSLFDTVDETREYCRENGISKLIIADENVKEAQ